MGPHVLVFGSTGQVARALSAAGWDRGVRVAFLDRQSADFSRPATLGAVVGRHRPDAVVIAAAYTAVDKAEGEERLAQLVNAEAPAVIAGAAAELEVPVVHLSTDYVFDGRKQARYEEDDEARPLNAYGRTKLAGELAVRRANPKHLILRTSWVFGPHGANFFNTMLKLAREPVLKVVADQRSCPTAASELARAIVRLVTAALDGAGPYGTFHLAGASDCTRYEFAEAIFAGLERRGVARPRVEPVPTADFPAAAARPSDSRLSCRSIEAAFGISLPGWREALPRALDEALAEVSRFKRLA